MQFAQRWLAQNYLPSPLGDSDGSGGGSGANSTESETISSAAPSNFLRRWVGEVRSADAASAALAAAGAGAGVGVGADEDNTKIAAAAKAGAAQTVAGLRERNAADESRASGKFASFVDK